MPTNRPTHRPTHRSPDHTGEWLLRPAVAEDLAEIGAVYWQSRLAALGAMPANVHDEADVLGWVAAWDLHEREVWVAEAPGALVGYAMLVNDWLEALYVAPSAWRSGVGTSLLDLVKTLRPDGFGLWVFESNAPARAFYRRSGLIEVEVTDGSGNEERAPDVRMEWFS